MEQSSLALLCDPVYHWYFKWNSQVLPYCVTLYIISTFNATVKSCLTVCPCMPLVLSMQQSILALLCVPVYHWYFQWYSQVLPNCVTLYIIVTFHGTVKSCLTVLPCISLVLSIEQSSLALLCYPLYHWYFQWYSQVLPNCVTLYIIVTFNGTFKSCLTVCPCISLLLSMQQSSLDLLCYPAYHCYFPWNSQVLPYCVSLYIIDTFNGIVKSCLTV